MPGDVRYLRTVYKEHVINVLVETVFVLFLSWDLKYTGLVTNLGPVPFVPWGTSRIGLVEVKETHNEKASTAQDLVLAVGVKRDDIIAPDTNTN